MYYFLMDGRAISHEVLEHFRFSAIKLHRKNIPVNDIADSFRVTPQAVYRWLNKEKETGKRSLKSTKSPGPRIRHLIKHKFKIEYHPKHMPRLLKNLGLELKFPERRALYYFMQMKLSSL